MPDDSITTGILVTDDGLDQRYVAVEELPDRRIFERRAAEDAVTDHARRRCGSRPKLEELAAEWGGRHHGERIEVIDGDGVLAFCRFAVVADAG